MTAPVRACPRRRVWYGRNRTLSPVVGTAESVKVIKLGDAYILSNEQLSITTKKGCITSLVDRSTGMPRETTPTGSKANQFMIFDDKPLINWQVWDV
jgi:hypothetical protein